MVSKKKTWRIQLFAEARWVSSLREWLKGKHVANPFPGSSLFLPGNELGHGVLSGFARVVQSYWT